MNTIDIKNLHYGRIFVVILIFVSAVLLGIAMSKPWYHYTYRVWSSERWEEVTWEFTFEDVIRIRENSDPIMSGSDTFSYDYYPYESVKPTFDNTSMITTIALSITLLFLIGSILIWVKSIKIMKIVVLVMGWLAFVSILMAPYYLMTTLPSAWDNRLDVNRYTESFSGSEDREWEYSGTHYESEWSWGASEGWYLTIIASIPIIIAFIILLYLLYKERRKVKQAHLIRK